MKQIIQIQNKDGKQVVSARELYESLGFDKSNWSKWYKKNIVNNKFSIENQDFAPLVLSTNKKGRGKYSQDFALSIDFAKSLCMLARTEQGQKIRGYFIEMEKKAQEATKPLSTLDILEMNIKALREHRIELDEVKQDVLELKAKTTTRPEYYTVAGYATLNGVTVNLRQASALGRKASKLCRDRGLPTDKTPCSRFGVVKMYPKSVLDDVFTEQRA